MSILLGRVGPTTHSGASAFQWAFPFLPRPDSWVGFTIYGDAQIPSLPVELSEGVCVQAEDRMCLRTAFPENSAATTVHREVRVMTATQYLSSVSGERSLSGFRCKVSPPRKYARRLVLTRPSASPSPARHARSTRPNTLSHFWTYHPRAFALAAFPARTCLAQTCVPACSLAALGLCSDPVSETSSRPPCHQRPPLVSASECPA